MFEFKCNVLYVNDAEFAVVRNYKEHHHKWLRGFNTPRKLKFIKDEVQILLILFQQFSVLLVIRF